VKKFLRDMTDQLWTLLGMFVAYVVLEGTAKDVVGWCIVGTFILWTATYPLRKD
jgi:fumarate reductase subunit C